MTIELGEKIVEGSTGVKKESKPLKAFHALKNMAAGQTIEGIYQGKFESKKTPGAFFHVFQDRNGDGFGYGTCKALEDKIDMIKQEAEKRGASEKELYAVITFNGRVPNKSGGRTYYSFSTPTIYKIVAQVEAKAAEISADSIPF
jgi:hypothetical protein